MLRITPSTFVSNVAAYRSAVWSSDRSDLPFGPGIVYRDIKTAKSCLVNIPERLWIVGLEVSNLRPID